MHYTFLAIDLQMLHLCIYAPQFQLKYEWKVYYKGLRIVAVAPLESQEVFGYISETISLILFLIILTYQVVTQLFFKTQLGQRSQNRFIPQLKDSENDEQDDLVTMQDSEERKAAIYSEIDPPPRRDAVPLSCFANLRSRRNTTNSVSGSQMSMRRMSS